ncbi:DNA topoisomerase [Chishuiella sp.]|uniref:DNA topoisomerase n=1 Tax=Chishuiella sp. TaxID=1969467 RepID=UPI0028A63924|nr:DNA topoisomerase [Chishuiella sp.]
MKAERTSELKLICERYLEHINFKEKTYFQLELLHTKAFIEFKSLSKFKCDTEKEVKNILKSVERIGKAEILAVEIKKVIEDAPLLFNLIDLQKKANEEFNLTSEETLIIAQSLYEKKFITYPIIENKFISEDLWNEIPNLVRILQERENYKKAVSNLKWGFFNKKIVSNLKLINHHGLLITKRIPSALSIKETIIYQMIAFRFLESISKPCIKEMTTIELEILQHKFSSKSCKIIEAGWRAIQGNFSEETEIRQDLPSLKNGDELKVKKFLLLKKRTRPPKLYTEADLLKVMEVSDKLINKLLIKKYIVRKNKFLIPTEKGLKFYEYSKNKVKVNPILPISYPKLNCPKCKNQHLIINEKKIRCSTTSCNWMLFRTFCGVLISIKEIENLINIGKTSLIKGMQSRSGKKFNAFITLNEKAESFFIIENTK